MAPLLDLGFSSFESVDHIYRSGLDGKLRYEWLYSWELVSFIDQFNFVADPIMYRIYCAEYDIPCDYTDEECKELADKFKQPIHKFEVGLLMKLICDVKTKWTELVQKNVVTPRLPPTAKTALINFVNITNKMAESDLAPHFISLFASLSEAHKERTSKDMDVSDVQENITKDQFMSYCSIFDGYFSKLFQFNDDMPDQKLFNGRIAIVKKVLMTILWMCEPESTNRIYASDILFDKWILPYMEGVDVYKETLNKYSARKSIPMTYALCVTPETIDLVPEDEDANPNTDSFRFMTTLLLTNQPVEE